MKKLILSSALCATMMFAANSEYKYEITPMIGGAFTEGNLDLDRDYANAGLALGFNLDDSMFDQVELGFLRSLGDVDYTGQGRDTGITRIFTNLVKEYSLYEKGSLYALVGAGVEIFDDQAFGNEDGLFGNYGVGYKYKLDNGMSFKMDLRHLIETDHGDNNLLYTVGFSIPFGKKAAAAPVMEKKAEPVMKEEPKAVAIVVLKINFDTNSSVIHPQYDGKISGFADYLKANPSLKATIEGHTDSRASEAYNQKLSEKRAEATVEAIKAQDVAADRINAVGFGESQPISSNDDEDGRAENRRIQAVILK